MANNNNKTPSNSFDFDKDLDIGDLGFGEGEGRDQKEEQGPIRRLSVSFAEGARDTLTSPSTIRNVTLAALPEGYSTAFNTATDVVRTSRELYNEAVHELRPVMPAIRRLTAKAIPTAREYLPKRFADKIEEFSKPQQSGSGIPSQEQIDRDQITAGISEVFKLQMEQTAEQHEADLTEGRIRERMEHDRFLSTRQLLSGIRLGVERQVEYQDQITSRFQRKSLELQYRQYFVARDTMKMHARFYRMQEETNKALIRNTSATEAEKEELAKRKRGRFRSIADRLTNSFQASTAKYVSEFASKFKNNISMQLRGAAGNASNMISQFDMANDMMSGFGDDMNAPTMGEMAAGSVGGVFADVLAGLIASGPLKDLLSKNKNIQKGSSKLSYIFNNIGEHLTTFANKTDDSEYSTFLGGLKRAFKDFIPRNRLDNVIAGPGIFKSQDAASFDNITRKSIIEIIPGYLSRIHQEIASMRAGETVERVVYNHDRARFDTLKGAQSDAARRIQDPVRMKQNKGHLDKMMAEIDPEGKLADDPELRNAIMKQIMMDTLRGDRAFDFDRLVSTENTNVTAHISLEQKEQIAKKLGWDVGKRDDIQREKIDSNRRQLRESIPDMKNALQVYQELGLSEMIDPLEIYKGEGFTKFIDYSKLLDNLVDFEDPDDNIDVTQPPPIPTGIDVVKSQLQKKVEAARAALTTGARGIFDSVNGVVESPMEAATAAATSIASQVQSVRNNLDVYVRGRATPAIRAALLAAGEYFDQITRTPIASLNDIKGPVVDRLGRLVLSAQDVVDGLIDNQNTPLTDVENRIRSTVTQLHERHVPPPIPEGAKEGAKVVPAVQHYQGEASSTESAQMAPTVAMADDRLVDLNNEQVELLKVIFAQLVENGKNQGGEHHHYHRGLMPTLLGKTLTGIGAVGKGIYSYVTGVYKGIWKGGKSVVGAASSLLGGTFRFARDTFGTISDIYVTGERQPRLYATKIRAQQYRDQKTQKIIKKLSDITGPVEDIADPSNPIIVLSQDDYAKTLHDGRGRRVLQKLTRAAASGAMAILGGYAQLASLPFRAISWAVKSTSAMVRAMGESPDLYLPPDMDTPRLFAKDLKLGFYSNDKGRLKRWEDLVGGGHIKDQSGNVVVEADRIKHLVTKNGKPYKSLAGKLLGFASNVIGGPLSYIGKVWGGAFRGLGAIFGLGTDIFTGLAKRIGGIFNPKIYMAENERLVNAVTDIYKLLDSRLPKPLKDGSWQKQQSDELAEDKAEEAEKERQEEESKSPLGRFASFLASKAKGIFGGDDEEEEDEEEEDDDDGDTTIIAGGGGGDGKGRQKSGLKKGGRFRQWRRNRAAKKLRKQRAKARKPPGRMGQMVSKIPGAKKLGKFKPRSLSPGGLLTAAGLTLGGSYVLDKTVGDGAARQAVDKGIDVAGDVATAASIASMVTGGSAAAGTAAATTAAAGTAAAGATAATAGATGAAATGGGLLFGSAATIAAPLTIAAGLAYLGGRYNMKWTGDHALRDLRMSQYGIDPKDKYRVNKIMELEALLEPNVAMGGGVPNIAQGKVKEEDVFAIFGLNDVGFVNTVKSWFTINGGKKSRLTFAEWFNKRFKPIFFSYYTALHQVGRKDISISEIDTSLKNEQKVMFVKAVGNIPKSYYDISASPFDGETIATGYAFVKAFHETAVGAAQREMDGKGDSKAMRWAKSLAALSPGGALAMKVVDSQQKKKDAKSGADLMAGKMSKDQAEKIAAGRAELAKGGGKMTSLKAIRMKSYGLVELDKERVDLLEQLEKRVSEDIISDSDGGARLDEKPETYLEEFSSKFGIAPDDEDGRDRWLGWFKRRFMAVLLKLVTVVKAIKRDVKPLEAESFLKPAQTLTVANEIISAVSKYGFSIGGMALLERPIWLYTDSPWDAEEKLNNDSKSTASNIEVLKQNIVKEVVEEPKAQAQSATTTKTQTTANKPTPTVQQQAQAQAALRLNPAPAPSMAGNPAYPGLVEVSTSTGGVFGNAVANVAAVAGTIENIPNVSGEGKDAMAPAIIAAAKIAGVDPNLAMTMANVESRFKPGAGAQAGGSAKGLYQFIDGTWSDMMKKYGSKYGIPEGTSPLNPMANALLGNLFIRDNREWFKKKFKRDATDTETYLMHLLGLGDFKKLMDAPSNVLAQNIPWHSNAVVTRNKPFFIAKGNRPRTKEEMLAYTSDQFIGKNRIVVDPSLVKKAMETKPEVPTTGGYTSTTANEEGGLAGASQSNVGMTNTGSPPVLGGAGASFAARDSSAVASSNSYPGFPQYSGPLSVNVDHGHQDYGNWQDAFKTPSKGSGDGSMLMVGANAGGAPSHRPGEVDPVKDFALAHQMFPEAKVTSLHRSASKNASVGGSRRSWHVRGGAGDFVIENRARRAQFIQLMRSWGYDAIDEGDHVHLEPADGRKVLSTFTPADGKSLGAVPTGHTPPVLPKDQWSAVKSTNSGRGVDPQSVDRDAGLMNAALAAVGEPTSGGAGSTGSYGNHPSPQDYSGTPSVPNVPTAAGAPAMPAKPSFAESESPQQAAAVANEGITLWDRVKQLVGIKPEDPKPDVSNGVGGVSTYQPGPSRADIARSEAAAQDLRSQKQNAVIEGQLTQVLPLLQKQLDVQTNMLTELKSHSGKFDQLLEVTGRQIGAMAANQKPDVDEFKPTSFSDTRFKNKDRLTTQPPIDVSRSLRRDRRKATS